MKYYKLLFYLIFVTSISFAQDWQLPEEHMYTRWANFVCPDDVLPEYPRPQMVRENWMNLNGQWDYAIADSGDEFSIENITFNGKILVPFPVESAMSGVKGTVAAEDKVIYQRSFTIPEDWKEKRILLNFDAVDWETTVWLNNKEVGTHKGGYDSFSFDVTDAVNDSVEQILTVSVWDPTEEGHQPRGKQTTDTHGFWYTAVTGIWQTVWLEPVELYNGHIRSIKITTDIDEGTVTISPLIKNPDEKQRLKVTAMDGEKIVGVFTGLASESVTLKILEPKLWSPESPFLYDLQVELLYDGQVVDKIDSYFGMRKISLKHDRNGVLRIALNNEIYFQFGMLDQGWWPDGLYRAPLDEALKYDIEVAKKLGFNMLRKHGKVEPERWYYWCDKLGILVWQDMTPGDIDGEYGTDRTQESKDQFELELSEMITQLYNYPSIVTWVIFNEGWGQYDTERLVNFTRKLDITRLVVGASGFMDKGFGDLLDVHGYPGPTGADPEESRAATLGEFGGLGFPLKGHLWNADKAWGYVKYENVEELSDAYEALIHKLHPYVSKGISGAIYTQITDVENEVNGMMTYDREVIKMNKERVNKISEDLRSVQPGSYKFTPIIQTSQKSAQKWKYSFDNPGNDWISKEYDDSGWLTGEGGFGDPKDYNPVIRTEWTTEELWLRKEFDFEGDVKRNIVLKVHHQFEADNIVYLNGKKIAESPEHSNAYTIIPLDKEAKSLLKQGANILAVHCKQNLRRAYFDLDLFFLEDPE